VDSAHYLALLNIKRCVMRGCWEKGKKKKRNENPRKVNAISKEGAWDEAVAKSSPRIWKRSSP
jgi:hypothetical protein